MDILIEPWVSIFIFTYIECNFNISRLSPRLLLKKKSEGGQS